MNLRSLFCFAFIQYYYIICVYIAKLEDMPVAYTNTIRDYFATLPIDKAWVYGSFARGEERPDSDIDIMVRYSPEGVSLLKHAHIMNTLSDLLGREVDLVEEDCLLPFAAKSANEDKILVYERNN